MESTNKLYVGNLSFHTTDDILHQAFAQCGQVVEAKVILDRTTGRSRGFGFVMMASEADAQQAIDQMNNAELDGRVLRVNPSEERAPRLKTGGDFGRSGGRMGGPGGPGGGRSMGGRFDRGGSSDRRSRW